MKSEGLNLDGRAALYCIHTVDEKEVEIQEMHTSKVKMQTHADSLHMQSCLRVISLLYLISVI